MAEEKEQLITDSNQPTKQGKGTWVDTAKGYAGGLYEKGKQQFTTAKQTVQDYFQQQPQQAPQPQQPLPQAQSGPSGSSLSYQQFVTFASVSLSFFIALASMLYLSLVCQKPCVAKMFYILNISLMFIMFLLQLIYVLYVLINEGATKSPVFWIRNVAGSLILLMLGIWFSSVYNENIGKDVGKLKQQKEKMKYLNITSCIIGIGLVIMYAYDWFPAKKA